jgi:hypothetical protein
LCTGALRKAIFSKWHPPVLGPSWRQNTLPGCRRSPLFQLRATPSGARWSFWPWRGGSIRRRLTPLSRLLVFATGPVRWTNSAAHPLLPRMPLPRTETMFARLTHKVQAPPPRARACRGRATVVAEVTRSLGSTRAAMSSKRGCAPSRGYCSHQQSLPADRPRCTSPWSHSDE